jgi:phage FluMu protein Com
VHKFQELNNLQEVFIMQAVVVVVFLALSIWGFAANGAAFFLFFLLLAFIAFVAYLQVSTMSEDKPPPPLTEVQKEEIALQRQKFDALGDAIDDMTVAQIAVAVGGSERSIKTKLIRAGRSCADFDGEDVRKTIDANEGKSASQLRSERMEKEKIGILSPKVKCPHCDTIGQVYKNTNATQTETTQSSRLTAAVLEGQKITSKKVTQFHCKNCETTWTI